VVFAQLPPLFATTCFIIFSKTQIWWFSKKELELHPTLVKTYVDFSSVIVKHRVEDIFSSIVCGGHFKKWNAQCGRCCV
jgi:hypothetical protein